MCVIKLLVYVKQVFTTKMNQLKYNPQSSFFIFQKCIKLLLIYIYIILYNKLQISVKYNGTKLLYAFFANYKIKLYKDIINLVFYTSVIMLS